jgi:hypothetical protein
VSIAANLGDVAADTFGRDNILIWETDYIMANPRSAKRLEELLIDGY